MATEPSPQRAYRAACPNCGAPVEFRSAAAPFAVCGFCRSTVVRAGDELRKMNQNGMLGLVMAHLFSLALVRDIFARHVAQGSGPSGFAPNAPNSTSAAEPALANGSAEPDPAKA